MCLCLCLYAAWPLESCIHSRALHALKMIRKKWFTLHGSAALLCYSLNQPFFFGSDFPISLKKKDAALRNLLIVNSVTKAGAVFFQALRETEKKKGLL